MERSSGLGLVCVLAALVGPLSCTVPGRAVGPAGGPAPVGWAPDGASFADEFETLDPAIWRASDHWLGRGRLDPGHVRLDDGTLALVLPAGSHQGAEIRSRDRRRYGTYAAVLKASSAEGSVSALFLYEGARGGNDEIDLEILNGTDEVLFSTWQDGRQTNGTRKRLGFDPAKDFHRYAIHYAPGRVTFYVDGEALETFARGVPSSSMYVMANAWWPLWLSGDPPAADAPLRIDRITLE